MRILHFSADDIAGGAAKAAYRLNLALCQAGHHSQMIVLRKMSDDDRVIQAPPQLPRPWTSRFNRLRQHLPGLRRRLPKANYTFNFDVSPKINLEELLASQIQSPDIICLHWINELLDVKAIWRLYEHFHCPIVWVMADQEPMTGGCHYSFGCEGYKYECGNCPQLSLSAMNDYSRLVWQRKKEFLVNIPLCFVAPTSWGKQRLGQSSLFGHHRCELIPYPIDQQVFRPFNRGIARELLNLPKDTKIIFIGATYLEDRRKGMRQMIEALAKVRGLVDNRKDKSITSENIFLLVAGHKGSQLLAELPFDGKYIGQLKDELTLALAYQASDIFVCPSIEDAGPMMIPEAMMCGIPVVAFNTGGAPDLIENGRNGYLARLAESEDLARGIVALLEADNGHAMSHSALTKAKQKHSPSIVSEKYSDLFQSLMK